MQAKAFKLTKVHNTSSALERRALTFFDVIQALLIMQEHPTWSTASNSLTHAKKISSTNSVL